MAKRPISPVIPVFLIGAAVVLVIIGIAGVSSASYIPGKQIGDSTHYMKRQVLYAAIAFIACFSVAQIGFKRLMSRSAMQILAWLAFIGLVSVFIPGLKVEAKGGCRWISLGVVNLQPSEFVRIAVVMLLSGWYGKVSRHADRIKEGVLLPTGGIAIVLALLFGEHDFGSILLTTLVSGMMMIVAGVRLKHLAVLLLVFAVGMAVLLSMDSERMRRISAFLNPGTEEVQKGDDYQVNQSLVAFRNGGLCGVGFWGGMQRERFLPEAHTDFILSVIGEELGFLCTGTVVLLYMVMMICGFTAAAMTDDRQIALVLFGLTTHLCISAAYNIAVVTRLAPTKGLALPFISYGGSNLVASSIVLGLILSAIREVNNSAANDASCRPVSLDVGGGSRPGFVRAEGNGAV